MSHARISNGVWTRNVPWKQNGEWRTDISKKTLSDYRLRFTKFVLNEGPTVVISAEALRRVVVGGRDHYANKIWGPFNINPASHTVNGVELPMEVQN
jgi:hypothetical protein